jgi:hypothetical protein
VQNDFSAPNGSLHVVVYNGCRGYHQAYHAAAPQRAALVGQRVSPRAARRAVKALSDIVVRQGQHSDVDSYSSLYGSGNVHKTELTTL